MSTEAVSLQRRCMIEDMTIQQFGGILSAITSTRLASSAFRGRSSDLAEPEDLRRYQLHRAPQGASSSHMK